MAASKIILKLFATLQDYLPPEAKTTNSLVLEIDHATTVEQIVARFRLPQKLVHLVLIDGHFVTPADRSERVLRDGETLAIWPPIGGG